MSAKKTGGTASRQRAKDAATAAMMKKQGIERKVCTCPICHNLIGVSSYYPHVTSCKG